MLKEYLKTEIPQAIIRSTGSIIPGSGPNQRKITGEDFILRIREGTNIIIVSTPSLEVADVIRRITCMELRGKQHPFNVYVADPDDSYKGVRGKTTHQSRSRERSEQRTKKAPGRWFESTEEEDLYRRRSRSRSSQRGTAKSSTPSRDPSGSRASQRSNSPLPKKQQVKVVDSENNIVPVGTPGQLCARGYLVFLEYYNEPDMTKDVVRDKWYHTGDEAVMTEDGHVIISGRISDMICRGGENIYPLEIEKLLYTHPDIQEVQVVGVPDKRFGEEICAWVSLKEGKILTERDIKMFCDGKISRFKTPKYVLFVDSFPKTISGKIQKFKMREQSRKTLNL
ncbi:hypothetical protein HPB49_019378 [Dermacentor silvarum]|uniref:Uncharacterized protein n=1 Tax=Dermacentor silvarum TaxID=543639 RepID=A0ACB8CAV1_DERSI|nr:hypothetical protein HPB49_019378 [Dermacentor silvarum]